MPDQPIQQADRADRQRHREPGQGENEFAGPVHHARFEQESADRKEHRHRDILHEVAAAPVDAAAIAPLVERAERDADQRYRRRNPAPAGLPAHRPVVQDQRNACKPDQQPAPLHRGHALTQPAVRNGGRQDRLQAWNQRREAGGNRQRDRDRRAAEVNPVYQNAGDDAVPDLDTVRPRRPGDGANDAHQHHDDRHADRQIRQGIGIVDNVFGTDEASAPQQDENRRRRAGGEFVEVRSHLPPLLPDHMLCGKHRSRGETCAILHIEGSYRSSQTRNAMDVRAAAGASRS